MTKAPSSPAGESESVCLPPPIPHAGGPAFALQIESDEPAARTTTRKTGWFSFALWFGFALLGIGVVVAVIIRDLPRQLISITSTHSMADREPTESSAAAVFPGRTEYYGNTPATHAFGDVSHAVRPAAPEPRVQPGITSANTEGHDYGKPVQEMTTYLAGLKAGRFVFNWAITGEEAAKQLGFTRLFASGYDEIVLRAKARAKTQGSVNIGDIISDFQGVVEEEQRIAELMVSHKEYVAVIAYLRALQNGDVVFPGPQDLAPTPPVLLVQLMTAYPETRFDPDDPVFASVYRQTRVFAKARMQEASEVWAQEIIGEFRRQIIHSASRPVVVSSPTDCERAHAVGVLMAVVSQCSGLRLGRSARAAANALDGRQGASDCLTTARDKLKDEFGRKPGNEIAGICGFLERQVKAGKVANLDIAN